MSLDTAMNDLLTVYTKITPPPLMDDAELEAWAELYEREPVLREVYYFDLFAASPVSACLAVGVSPRPYDNGALPTAEGCRHLLPDQRRIAGLVAL